MNTLCSWRWGSDCYLCDESRRLCLGRLLVGSCCSSPGARVPSCDCSWESSFSWSSYRDGPSLGSKAAIVGTPSSSAPISKRESPFASGPRIEDFFSILRRKHRAFVATSVHTLFSSFSERCHVENETMTSSESVKFIKNDFASEQLRFSRCLCHVRYLFIFII